MIVIYKIYVAKNLLSDPTNAFSYFKIYTGSLLLNGSIVA